MTSPIEMMFDGVKWKQCTAPNATDDLPHVTHEGVLELPGFGTMRCYRLSNGMSVFNGEDMEAIFGGPDTLPEVRRLLDNNRLAFHKERK